jgi:hypothetical protein
MLTNSNPWRGRLVKIERKRNQKIKWNKYIIQEQRVRKYEKEERLP